MTNRAATKIADGLKDALHHAKVRNAITEWVLRDIPVAAQIAITTEMVDNLADAICGTKAKVVRIKMIEKEKAE